MPKSDTPIIFSLSLVTVGVQVACVRSGVGISKDFVVQRVWYLFQKALTHYSLVALEGVNS